MNSIEKLTLIFEKFPGIGPRQARRFVQHLLAAAPGMRQEFAEIIKQLGAETVQCKQCYRWFVKNEGKSDLCSICGDHHRDDSTLFVVEKEADIDNVERSGFRGRYFVLGGTIPLASEEPHKHIRLRELERRVEHQEHLAEVILGLSATTEGDHTRIYLEESLRPLTGSKIKLSSLGRGLSTGSELEYADPDTIAQALGNRH